MPTWPSVPSFGHEPHRLTAPHPHNGATQMTIRSDIKGLTEVGATAQTIALANVLDRDPSARQDVRALLDELEQPIRYCNEDGDRRAAASAALASIIRKYNGPKIY